MLIVFEIYKWGFRDRVLNICELWNTLEQTLSLFDHAFLYSGEYIFCADQDFANASNALEIFCRVIISLSSKVY